MLEITRWGPKSIHDLVGPFTFDRHLVPLPGLDEGLRLDLFPDLQFFFRYHELLLL